MCFSSSLLLLVTPFAASSTIPMAYWYVMLLHMLHVMRLDKSTGKLVQTYQEAGDSLAFVALTLHNGANMFPGDSIHVQNKAVQQTGWSFCALQHALYHEADVIPDHCGIASIQAVMHEAGQRRFRWGSGLQSRCDSTATWLRAKPSWPVQAKCSLRTIA
jgi:hypothetical protein